MYPPVGYLTTSASPVSQMLIDVFYLPLKRWAEEQSSKAERQAVDISQSDIDKVFSNVEELVVFSRCAHMYPYPEMLLEVFDGFFHAVQEGDHGEQARRAITVLEWHTSV